ncbi:MAG TPA: methyltransferase domain-containing protein [Burkholderiales bacterium]|nr:methyltransferase domain-containing protein [Burkholderiales bacterium]
MSLWRDSYAGVWTAFVLAALVAGCAGGPGAPLPDYAAIVAAPDRSEADRLNDQRRKPVELFGFTGARPGMKVLDMGAGGGYSTEMLARIVAPGGTVYSQSPAGMFPGAIKAYEARAKSPAMKNAVRVERPFEDPLPPDVAGLDLITFFFFYHDTVHLGVDRPQMNRRMYEALKPGGILVLADHSARPGDGASVTKSLHRIEESVVRRELEAAGFQFVAEGRFLRNPDDPRSEPVAKPKVPNDEFVLKYRKP